MRAKLSDGRVAIITESMEKLSIQAKSSTQTIHLSDEDFERLRLLINKYLDRYKSSGVQELLEAVDRLAAAMKEKLELKYLEGWDGWQDREREKEFIIQALEHLKKGDILDTINFLMFVWNMKDK